MELQQICFILLPFITGLCVIYFSKIYSKGPIKPMGIQASIVSSISLLFALFASLIFTEVWTRTSKINLLLMEQASSLRALKRITEPLGENSIYFSKAVSSYIEKIKEQEVTDIVLKVSKPEKDESYRLKTFSKNTYTELYTLAMDPKNFKGNIAMQNAFYTNLESLRHAWFERKELRKTKILPEKIYVLFIFGLLTQIAVAFSHLDDRKSNKIAVILFTITFSIALFILALIESSLIDSHFTSVSVLNDVL
jgi:hypothetical protein